MDEKQLQALYDAMQHKMDLGDYNQFKSSITGDQKFRKAFYDEASHDLDLGDYNSFESSFKKKELSTPSFGRLQSSDVEAIKNYITGGTPQDKKAQRVRDVNQVVSQNLPSKKDVTAEAITRLQEPSLWESINQKNRLPGLSDQNDDPIGDIVNKNEQEKNNIKNTQFTEGANPIDVHKEIAIRDTQNDLLKNHFFQDGYQAADYMAGKEFNPNSLTHQIALQKIQERQKVDDALNTTTDFEKAAVKYNTGKENEFQNDVPPSKKADYVINFLNDPNVVARAQRDPEFKKEYEAEQFNFYNHYPAKAKEIVNTKIAQKLEDEGMTHWYYNNPTPEKADKVVKQMVESGEMNAQELAVYNGERNNLGTLKTLIFGSPIPTADVVNAYSRELSGALGGMASSVRDISNKVTGGAFQKLGLLESDEDRMKRIEEEQLSTPTVQGKGAHGVLSGIAGLTGSFTPMILGEMAGVPTMFTAGLQFEGANADDARQNIKGKANQAMYTILATTGDMIAMKLLPTKEAGAALRGEFKDEIVNVLEQLSNKKIDEATASNILGNKIKDFVGSVATSNTKSSAVMEALNFGHNGLKAAFGGRDFNLENEAKEAIKNYPSLWLNNTFLSALGTMGSKEKAVNGRIIRQFSEDPFMAKFRIDEMAKDHPELAAVKEQALSNLDHAIKVGKELDARTDLSERQKDKYMMLSMKEKILNEKAKEIPDKNLRAETEKELTSNEIEKERILNPDMGSKKFIEELYDNELLPKADMRMLEDEKGKFNEHSVGAYVKYIAQQANNLDENWNPHATKAPDVSHIPQQLIEFANDRWHKEIEAAKEKQPERGISVIMPEENKKPNIIEPVKTQENELQPSNEAMGELPAGQENRQEVGGGQPSGQVSGQESGKENINQGQEKEVAKQPYVQYPPTSLNYMGTGKLETEFGIEERQPTERKRDVYTIKEAEDLIAGGLNVGKLMDDTISGNHIMTDAEYVAMTKYASGVADNLRNTDRSSPEYDRLLDELNKVATAANASGQTGGRGHGIRARFKTVPDGSYGDFMLTESQVNNDAPLTPHQKEVANVDWNRFEAAQKDLAEREAKLNEERKAFAAEQELAKTRKSTPKTKKTHEDFAKERTAIIEHMREQLRKARGETQATVVPYAKELAAIAPDVAKLVKSLVEEGAMKLADVIKEIHPIVKEQVPDATEKDIRDIIAGEYNERKVTKREAAIRAENLRIEAQLLNKLEKVAKGEVPKNEKAQVKRNQEIEDLLQKVQDLTKENIDKGVGEFGLKKIQDLIKRNEKAAKDVNEKIKKGDFAPAEKKQSIYEDKELQKRFPEEYKRLVDSRDKLIKVKRDITIRRLRQLYENKSSRDRAYEAFSKAINVPRTLMASWDFSAPLRQGIVASISHPAMATDALKFMFKAAGFKLDKHGITFRSSEGEKQYNRWLEDVHNDPRWDLSQKIKVAITDPHSLHIKESEEAFQGEAYAEKLPILGPGVKASERAYIGYLNHLRWNLFNMFVDRFEDTGKTYENSKKLYEGLGSYINSATGRGGYGIAKLEEFSPVMNWFLFASKLIASRLNMLGLTDIPNLAVQGVRLTAKGLTGGKFNPDWGLNFGFYSKLPPELRVEAMKDMLKFLAVGSAFLAGAKHIPGLQVESDPRSSDFGKIRHGNTRWDIWGGFQPYARVLTQVLMAERKATSTGNISELNGKGYRAETRFSPLVTFGRQKLAPIPGAVINLAMGTDATGQPVTWGGQLTSNLLPLVGQDIWQGMKDQGVQALFTVGIPSAFGVGVQTHTPFPVKPIKTGGGGGAKGDFKKEGTKSHSHKQFKNN